ncbi:helix-turn-helix transcriptional regulator [Ruficoccus amylovorans]|uniref:Helix-turn-helix transcriptional regulator n=1 Tax=Ruficoccus amylovorans TaxID=1804625 RepID=A0A842HHS0_9BACT|nr:helix-turn-helix transcriptional regulator [Ruficoccus amylovorans]
MFQAVIYEHHMGVPNSYEALVHNLRHLRELNHLTQEQAAEKAGLDYKHYQGIEAGRRPELRLSTIDKLAAAYGKEAWQLLWLGPQDRVVMKRPPGRPPKTASKEQPDQSRSRSPVK